MLRRSFALVAVAALSTWACASTPEDPNAPQGCVIVDNTDGGGIQSQMYLIGASDGSRTRIGTVTMGRTLRFCSTRLTLPGRYFVLVEEPAVDAMDPALGDNRPPPIRSDDFAMTADDVWTWHIRIDRIMGIGIRNVADPEPVIVGSLSCSEGGPGDC